MIMKFTSYSKLPVQFPVNQYFVLFISGNKLQLFVAKLSLSLIKIVKGTFGSLSIFSAHSSQVVVIKVYGLNAGSYMEFQRLLVLMKVLSSQSIFCQTDSIIIKKASPSSQSSSSTLFSARTKFQSIYMYVYSNCFVICEVAARGFWQYVLKLLASKY